MHRVSRPRIVAVVSLVLMLSILIWPTALLSQDADPIAEIETFLTNMEDTTDFSGTVLVAQGDEILLNKGYGMAVLEWAVPNTPDSIYRIASVTKQFTAMAILILQERDLLSVDDLICQYIENCPDSWANVTIHHLLTHTSGVPNAGAGAGDSRSIRMPLSLEKSIDLFRDEPLDFEPGEGWNYSNSGYILLGAIIEAASGDRYARFLDENIFEPLGLEHTDYDRNNRVIRNRAVGYASTSAIAEYIDMSLPHAAGALYSTTEDLFKWTQALYSGQVVSEETLQASFDAAVDLPSNTLGVQASSQYAYGLTIFEDNGRRMIGHDGGIYGFSTSLYYLPDDAVTVVVLSNFEGVGTNTIAAIIAGMLLGTD